MSDPATSSTAASTTQPSGQARPAESDAAVEFLTALTPEDPAVRRRAFAALLRAVTLEVQS